MHSNVGVRRYPSERKRKISDQIFPDAKANHSVDKNAPGHLKEKKNVSLLSKVSTRVVGGVVNLISPCNESVQ